ncbi:hypothetical protein DQM13_09460 [Limosilactobacillus fermentum]|nr:hypothetical protein [Limosilactobacillus fermentum]MCT4375316.1 hypothetical protein [Limosilactobacillus fermentum]QEY01889.1 IS3 family transposase [Limosilactobacillus fermentum]RDG02532.1 hypothetical protein DQM13_09460 [Limosilactobacillus fermentum]
MRSRNIAWIIWHDKLLSRFSTILPDSADTRQVLKEHHVFQSMSRKATCLDNAAMESFFHIMKVEVMDEHFEIKTALIEAMNEWIDFYNHRRIKTKLDGKSPVKYRELTVQKAA